MNSQYIKDMILDHKDLQYIGFYNSIWKEYNYYFS